MRTVIIDETRISTMMKVTFAAVLLFTFALNSTLGYADAFNQDPKGSSMKLVDFTPILMDSPFQIQYPEMWNVREEYWGSGRAGVFITREKINKNADKYDVGASISGLSNKFVNVSQLSWEEKMGLVIMDLKKEVTVLKGEEVEVGGKKAIKAYIESDSKKGIALAFVLGNHLYLVQLDAIKSEYEKYQGYFESMIDSFKWKSVKKLDPNYPPRKDPIITALLDGKPRQMVVNGEKKKMSLGDAIKKFINKEKK